MYAQYWIRTKDFSSFGNCPNSLLEAVANSTQDDGLEFFIPGKRVAIGIEKNMNGKATHNVRYGGQSSVSRLNP
jgi:hypothetical protein